MLAVENALHNFITLMVLSVFRKRNHQWQHLLYHPADKSAWVTQETC